MRNFKDFPAVSLWSLQQAPHDRMLTKWHQETRDAARLNAALSTWSNISAERSKL